MAEDKGRGAGDRAVQSVHARVIDSLSDCAVAMIDRHGAVLIWNHGAEALSGVPSSEAIGTDVGRLLPDCMPERMPDLLDAAIATGRAATEGWVTHADGGRLRCEAVFRPVTDDDGDLAGFSLMVRDITPARQHEEALRDSEARFRSIMDDSPVGFALVSLDGHWLEVNRALCDLLGYSAAELLKMDFQQITHGDDLDLDLHLVDELIRGDRATYRMEKRYIRKNGSAVWGLLSVSLMRHPDGSPAYFLSQVQDMTEVREIRRELEQSALHDPLTGLANRRKFQVVVADALEDARRSGTEHSLCFIDLDGFKAVNDTAGHQAGDRLLARVSRELERAVRGNDLVARLGGDEFAIILFDCPIDMGEPILNRLCERIADLPLEKGYQSRVTASIGMAPITADTVSAAEVLRQADMACYDVKKRGRNGVSVHPHAQAGLAASSR